MCLLLGLGEPTRASYAPDVYTEFAPLSPVYSVADVLVVLIWIAVVALHVWAAVLVIRVCRRYLARTDPRSEGTLGRQPLPTAAPLVGGTWARVGAGVVVPDLGIGAIGVALTLLAML